MGRGGAGLAPSCEAAESESSQPVTSPNEGEPASLILAQGHGLRQGPPPTSQLPFQAQGGKAACRWERVQAASCPT